MSAGGAGAVVRVGHLRKLKTMKKKFFVLRAETADCSARLEYYESEKKFRSGVAPRRVLPLKSCYNITRRLDLKQKHVIALFTREEQFCVVAENEQDLHGWLTAVLKHHRNEDASEELLHPIQHVWQVNVQKKGLGASKNIQGLYNLCLTDQTLTLVKIKSQNNVISDLGIPERVEYSLKNIRRCGDSECFFYMEVGRQTATGAGELWMHSDDANIAQSMHSTIYHAMRNCAKEHEHERDHIVIPKGSGDAPAMPARRQTYSDGRGRAGLTNERGLCMGSCLKPCVCADDSAVLLAPENAENQAPNANPLTQDKKDPPRVIKHHRTVSLPSGCPLFQEPLKIVHERTRSAPLTGDEVDRVVLEKSVAHSSCKAVNGTDVFVKKSQWSRRASTGTRLSKLSPAHSKNAPPLRSRCDSMPSRASCSMELDARAATRHDSADGLESRDETDGEWHRTPRIPEEPDFCDTARDFFGSLRGSVQHSRTSSMGCMEDPEMAGYLPMAAPHGEAPAPAPGHPPGHPAAPEGPAAYLPMAPDGLQSPHSGSVCSGTPSTDPRFSEYQLEPATSHIVVELERPPRAYSVGSRPAPRAEPPQHPQRHRAYSVGAHGRNRPPAKHQPTVASAPLLPRSSADDLMELDFSNNSPAAKMVVSRTPPAAGFAHFHAHAHGHGHAPRPLDEYVDMSPRNATSLATATANAGYVEMRPGDLPAHPHAAPAQPLGTSGPSLAAISRSPPADGYVEMNYGRGPTRPIDIARPADVATSLQRQPLLLNSSPEERRKRNRDVTPSGSQTLFPFSPESPASPPEFEEEMPHHPLTTVREISEECGRKSPEASSSPSYVKLAYNKPVKTPEMEDVACNPTATKILARDGGDRVDTTATLVLASVGAAAVARFSVADEKPPASPGLGPCPGPLNYAALDLEPRRTPAAPAPVAYTQIDFARSEKLAADGN